MNVALHSLQRKKSPPQLEPFHFPSTGWLLGVGPGGRGQRKGGLSCWCSVFVSHAYPQLTCPQIPSTSVLMGTPHPAPSHPPVHQEPHRPSGSSPLPILSVVARAHSMDPHSHSVSNTLCPFACTENHRHLTGHSPWQGYQGSVRGANGPAPSLRIAGKGRSLTH